MFCTSCLNSRLISKLIEDKRQIHLRNISRKIFQKKVRLKVLFHQDYMGRNATLSVGNNFSTGNGPVLPKQAQVVICGAGMVANSVAYHLVQNGWTDVLVLEKEKIGSGTSHFGSGTLGLFKPIPDRQLIMYSIKLYRKLQELGYDIEGTSPHEGTGDHGVLGVVFTTALLRKTSLHEGTGGYGVLDVVLTTMPPRKILSNFLRARFVENCEVEQVLTENSHIKAVSTSSGTVLCEYFVNCAGMWARGLGLRCSPTVRIPALPAEHFYVTTPPMADLDPWLPCVRDYDSHTYAREWEGGFMVGGFEKEAKPAFNGGDVPVDWKNNLPQDWKHFRSENALEIFPRNSKWEFPLASVPLWEKAIHRFPVLKDIGSATLSNSPDNFTPDGRWILGETPEYVTGYTPEEFRCNETWVKGLGSNYYRFSSIDSNDLFVQWRHCKVGNVFLYVHWQQRKVHYSILYPLQSEYKYARKLRCSPLYSVLETRGAVFGTRMGYERPLYFDSTYKPGNPLPQMPPGSFYKPRFFDFMLEEYLACREGVGIIDMSSFSKMQIKSSGTEVVDYLQKLCSNDVNIPVGGCAHTGMQNERGGYENDCMLVRLTNNSYFMVSPTSQQTRIFEWMHQNLPSDSTVDITDMTSMYTVINVVGPKSRELMAELSNSDINLHPFTYKKVNVGYASDVMVMSFTHTGEPGYCLYIPSEYALHVYDRLMMVGRDFGARDVGSLTQRFMRIERFMPFWAEELTSVTTPFEAGHGHRVKLDKEYFIGKFALQRQKDQGVTKRLVFFHLEDVDPNQHVWPWGGEPIYRNNECVGHVTSAGYGFTLSKLVCLGFIRHPGRNKGTRQIITEEFIMARNAKYELDIAGSRVVVKPHIHAPYFATANIDNSKKKYRPTVVNIKSPENIRLPYTA
uniref:(California timema) hypothetical protein n=1 Tax=Timema californicum TaxID=61474 RepID=A0A7R9IZE8_TIMCA|nr:unnamed protein product [Timema californicum]